jgi:starvation-inducible outer membrane lipoprotein
MRKSVSGGIMLVVATAGALMLSGCATVEDVKRAQATADTALSTAQQAQQTATAAQQSADQARAAAADAQSKIALAGERG